MLALEPILLADISPGATQGSLPNDFVAFEGQLFFSAHQPTTGRELWRSDGTPEGTVMHANLHPDDEVPPGWHGPGVRELLPTTDGLFVIADRRVTIDENLIPELWYAVGDESSFELLNDDLRSISNPLSHPEADQLYFVGNDEVHGSELWKSDGTREGTVMIADIGPGNASGTVSYLSRYNGHLYFFADDDIHGWELWRSDGTTEGTELVSDIRPGWGSSVSARSSQMLYSHPQVGIYFVADNGNGPTLYRSDGTAEGTKPVGGDLSYDAGGFSGYFRNAAFAGSSFYFSAAREDVGQELWVIRSGDDEPQLVTDIRLGPEGSGPSGLIRLGDEVLFQAYRDDVGWELWRSDGTAEGTVLVADVNPGKESGVGSLYHATNVHGTVFFSAVDGDGKRRGLWRTDGTTEGTQVIMQVEGSGEAFSSVVDHGYLFGGTEMLGVDGSLFFKGTDSPITFVDDEIQNDIELWALTPPPGDTNFDGLVDLVDFNRLKKNFGREEPNLAGDLNWDDVVDLEDFNILKENFGYGVVEPASVEIASDFAAAAAFDAVLKDEDEEQP